LLSRPRVPSVLLASALVCALVCAPRSAEAAEEPRTSSLSWFRMPGAESCIPTQTLGRAVEHRLGRSVFVSASQADVSVEGRIEKREGGGAATWHAVLTLRDAAGATLGTRELERPEASCDAMSEPLALIIAVMIDPDAASRPPAATLAPLPTPTPTPAPSPAPAEAPLPAPAPPIPTRIKDVWHFEGTGSGTVSTGLAPELGIGATVEGVLYPPSAPVGFRGYASLFLPTTASQRGASAVMDMVYVGSAVCPALRSKTGNLMLCVGGQLGVLRSHAETQNRGIEEKSMPLFNAVTEARFSLPLAAPVEIAGSVGGVLPIVRPTFRYTPLAGGPGASENLHKVAAFGVTASLGVGFYFP